MVANNRDGSVSPTLPDPQPLSMVAVGHSPVTDLEIDGDNQLPDIEIDGDTQLPDTAIYVDTQPPDTEIDVDSDGEALLAMWDAPPMTRPNVFHPLSPDRDSPLRGVPQTGVPVIHPVVDPVIHPLQLDNMHSYGYFSDALTIRVHDRIQDAWRITESCERIDWDYFCNGPLEVFNNCADSISSKCFKYYVGICRCPKLRWCQMSHSPHFKTYQFMWVLCFAETLHCRFIERKLIQYIRSVGSSVRNLQNRSAGSEQLKCDYVFVYMCGSVDPSFDRWTAP